MIILRMSEETFNAAVVFVCHIAATWEYSDFPTGVMTSQSYEAVFHPAMTFFVCTNQSTRFFFPLTFRHLLSCLRYFLLPPLFFLPPVLLKGLEKLNMALGAQGNKK